MEKMTKKREIILDTETTGLDPESGHRVIEIGAIELVNKVQTGNSYQVYLNPERDIPEESFRIHGISAEFLQDKPLFKQEVDRFLQFIGDSPLIAHNARFDKNFINSELKKIGRETIDDARFIDTMQLARSYFPRRRISLDALCDYFNIDRKKRAKGHGALIDVELLSKVYVELTGGLQEEFALTIKKEEIQEVNLERTINTERIIIKPSAEELKAHKKLLEKIAQCASL